MWVGCYFLLAFGGWRIGRNQWRGEQDMRHNVLEITVIRKNVRALKAAGTLWLGALMKYWTRGLGSTYEAKFALRFHIWQLAWQFFELCPGQVRSSERDGLQTLQTALWEERWVESNLSKRLAQQCSTGLNQENMWGYSSICWAPTVEKSNLVKKQQVWSLAYLVAWPEPVWSLRTPERFDTRLHLGHSATPQPSSNMSQNHCSLPGSASARRDVAKVSRPARDGAVSPHLHRLRTQRPPSVRFSAGARQPLTPLRALHTTAPRAESPGWSGSWWSNWSWHDCPPSTPESGWSFVLAACSLEIKGEGFRKEKERADSHSFGCRKMQALVTGTQCNFCFVTHDL